MWEVEAGGSKSVSSGVPGQQGLTEKPCLKKIGKQKPPQPPPKKHKKTIKRIQCGQYL